jgi:predicted neuraminidase
MKHISVYFLVCFLSTRISLAQKPDFILSQQLIFPPQSEHTHASSLVILPNGDKLAVWFQGSGERTADDVRLMGARLKKGTKTWTTPFLMADTPGLPDCNPVLFLNGSGKLFLVWIAVQAHRWENSILRVRTSTHYNTDGARIGTGRTISCLLRERHLQRKSLPDSKTYRGTRPGGRSMRRRTTK